MSVGPAIASFIAEGPAGPIIGQLDLVDIPRLPTREGFDEISEIVGLRVRTLHALDPLTTVWLTGLTPVAP